jgi:hypothetical protein
MHKSIAAIMLTGACLFARAAAADPDDKIPKCTLVKAAGTNVSIVIPIKPTMFPETHCRLDSRKIAEQWVADHAACAPKHTAFDYTITWGPKDKEKVIPLHGYCPHK